MSKNRRYSSLALLLISSAVLGAIRVGYCHPLEQIVYDISPSILDQDLCVQGSHTPTSSGSKAITGEISVAVVAVEFEDKRFTLTLDQLGAIFSQRLRKYIEEISYKKVTLRCNVQGIIRLAQTMRSYGRDAGNIDGEGGGIRTYKSNPDLELYADHAAAAFPVLFKIAAGMLSSKAFETPTEAPLSLKVPVGFWPSFFKYTFSRPRDFPIESIFKIGVYPSPKLMI